LNELLDLFGAGTVRRESHEGAGVENDTRHRAGRFTVFVPGGAPREEFLVPLSFCRGSRADCG
jgi:hypothetical protein